MMHLDLCLQESREEKPIGKTNKEAATYLSAICGHTSCSSRLIHHPYFDRWRNQWPGSQLQWQNTASLLQDRNQMRINSCATACCFSLFIGLNWHTCHCCIHSSTVAKTQRAISALIHQRTWTRIVGAHTRLHGLAFVSLDTSVGYNQITRQAWPGGHKFELVWTCVAA